MGGGNADWRSARKIHRLALTSNANHWIFRLTTPTHRTDAVLHDQDFMPARHVDFPGPSLAQRVGPLCIRHPHNPRPRKRIFDDTPGHIAREFACVSFGVVLSRQERLQLRWDDQPALAPAD